VYVPIPRHKAIAIKDLFRHSKITTPVTHKGIQLLEAPFVKQKINPLPCCHLAIAALSLEAIGAATELGVCAPSLELGRRILVRHHEPV
jgi:hypothetical protein